MIPLKNREKSGSHPITQVELLLNQYEKIIKFVDRPILIKFSSTSSIEGLKTTQEMYFEKAILLYRNIIESTNLRLRGIPGPCPE